MTLAAVETQTSTATVSKRGKKGKQEDLPGVEQSDRKIQEIEDLGDVVDELESELDTLKGKVKDANENLVAAMLKRERTYYFRPTWGKVLIKGTKTKAKVTKAGSKADDDSDDDSGEHGEPAED